MGKDKDTGVVRVTVNPKYFRPTEVVSQLESKRNEDVDGDDLGFVNWKSEESGREIEMETKNNFQSKNQLNFSSIYLCH